MRLLVIALLIGVLVVPCLAQTNPPPVRGTARTPTAGTATATARPTPPSVIVQATVSGSPITATEVNQSLANHWATPILRALIEERLIRQEAKKQGLGVPAEEVRTLFEAERAKFPSQLAFERDLQARGYTSQAYIETLMTEAMLNRLLARVSAVSDDEISRYYLDHQSDFSKPAQMRVFVIATETIEDAYLVRERLAAGDKFDVVAKELSKHPSKAKGGDLGWVAAADLPDKALGDAAQAMEPGVVSSPLRAAKQFFIVMVKERRPSQIMSLADAKDQIRQQLSAGKTVARDDYLAMLARQANIVVNWNPAKALNSEYLRLRDIRVVINGKPVELPQAPVKLPSGTIIVPAKPVLQAAGAVLTWQAKDQSLFAQAATGKIKITVNSPKLLVGADKPQTREMQTPATLREGILFFAPRVPLEALGATVTWDGLRNTLHITTAAQTMPSPTVPPKPSGLERQ